jgi:peptidoglycan/xylan/chitin deacetylase (PgdA/CDA1 family)
MTVQGTSPETAAGGSAALPPVPVLMYHSVSDDPPRATRRLSVHPEAFDAQMAVLARHGFTTLTFGQLGEALVAGTPLPERVVVLTFDDGYADVHQHALPRLDARGFTATVFVTTGWLDDAGDQAAGEPLDRMLSWAQVRELAGAGVEIGAHSHSHPQLDQVSVPVLRAELRHSKTLLEDGTGQRVHSLAYPFGYSSRRVRAEVAASGYRYAAAVANTLGGPRADRMALPRLTIRRSTDVDAFERIIATQDIGRIYAADRALTRGYAVVRRARYAVHRMRGQV